RQRARPELRDEEPRLGVEDREFGGFRLVAHMHDQRIKARALLGGEYLADRKFIERVGAEAINRFGRKGDELALAQDFPCVQHGGGSCGADRRHGWGYAHEMRRLRALGRYDFDLDRDALRHGIVGIEIDAERLSAADLEIATAQLRLTD